MSTLNNTSLYTVYIGLGGNMGDVVSSMLSALNALNKHPKIKWKAASSLYQTPPWGDVDQEEFINAAAHLETTLSPRELLTVLKSEEARLKRTKTRRWGPRTIDLDILTFGNVEVDEEGLQIPHPRMGERGFVLLPLSDLTKSLKIQKNTVSELLERCDLTGIKKLKDQNGWKSGLITAQR